MTIVVDASVAAKWFIQERGTVEADALQQEPIVAPDLVIPEVMNTAWKNVRYGRISLAQARHIGERLPALFSELVAAAALAPRAVEIAVALEHPVYDGFYLALAEERGTVLVTADDRLYRKTRRTKFAKLVRTLTTT